MSRHRYDMEKLRTALRRLRRPDLLAMLERAVESVPEEALQTIVGDRVELEFASEAAPDAASVLADVRKFHEASMRGEYYEDFRVDSHNSTCTSEGTDTFIAECERLVRRCVAAAASPPRAEAREAFELLFKLLRRIDEGMDDVIFFADEGGSYMVGVDWRSALPAYFQCLADTAPPDEFAREVHRAIADFAEYERPCHLTAARRVASAEQKSALKALLATLENRRTRARLRPD